jgi:hypothetical protein
VQIRPQNHNGQQAPVGRTLRVVAADERRDPSDHQRHREHVRAREHVRRDELQRGHEGDRDRQRLPRARKRLRQQSEGETSGKHSQSDDAGPGAEFISARESDLPQPLNAIHGSLPLGPESGSADGTDQWSSIQRPSAICE